MRLVANRLKGGIASQFSAAYNVDFEKGFPIGRTTRVPLRFRPTLRQGSLLQPNSVVIPETDITVGEPFGVDYQWDSMQRMFDMRKTEADLSKDLDQGAAQQIAQYIEQFCCTQAMLNIPNAVGALGTSPTNFDFARAARTLLFDTAGYQEDLVMNITPYAMETAANGERATFNPQLTISEAFTEGSIKRAGGFNFKENVSLAPFTVGVFAGTITVTSSNQVGSSIGLSSTNAADIIKAGTIIVFGNSPRINPPSAGTGLAALPIANNRAGFEVQEDVVFGGGVATVSIYPPIMPPGDGMSNISTNLTAGDSVTIMPNTTSPSAKSGRIGLVLASDAMALVGGEFPMPFTGQAKILSLPGIPSIKIRRWQASDINTDQHVLRFDCVIGTGRLQPDVAGVRLHLGS